MKLIEYSFPYNEINEIANNESYRKEVFRPIYHTHKWWAIRLGSVFRAITIGACLDKEENSFVDTYYKRYNLTDKVILDPFMGSGTTIGEAQKVGCKTIGCDINPVSSFIVRQALKKVPLRMIKEEFSKLEQNVAPQINKYYTKIDKSTGETCRVLYYFWVKIIKTPEGNDVPLFSTYIFSKNAYASKKPEAQIYCPHCKNIFQGRYDLEDVTCPHCGYRYNPQLGPVKGSIVTDPSNNKQYKIIDIVQGTAHAPRHMLYAMMVLTPNGDKKYLSVDKEDINLYNEASAHLRELDSLLPQGTILPGYNTNQVLNYNYHNWSDFFNDRQLLCLNLLLKSILKIENEDVRNMFLVLFSGTLEFNNIFCSFKGEGTGAVRHLFSNHILKPERMPLENSIWGTSKSSGTFSTLFKTRVLRAQEYLDNPFEIIIKDGKRSNIVCNNQIRPKFVNTFEDFTKSDHSCMILNGDSSNLSILPDKSVDAVITDPPYFDFVHYSELADFFYAWLNPVLQHENKIFQQNTSRREGEVQNVDPSVFANNLGRVFGEGNRVLKDEGVLVFSFHHSKAEGWISILKSLYLSKFYIKTLYPIKAEMDVSSPIMSSKSPISYDVLLVCKKLTSLAEYENNNIKEENSDFYISEFNSHGMILTDGDKMVIKNACAIMSLSHLFNSHSWDDIKHIAQKMLINGAKEMNTKKTLPITQLDFYEVLQQYPENIVKNIIPSASANMQEVPKVELLKNVLISYVKADNMEQYLDRSAKVYYTGKRFPATVALNKLYYFMPYIKGKGIKDLYFIKIARVGTRKEGQPDEDPKDFRLVFEIEFVCQLFDDYKPISLEIWHTFTDTTMGELLKKNEIA